MELKEGMYVRTKEGKILKCFKSESMNLPIYYVIGSKTNSYVEYQDVKNASERIIDILEVGDYVNGSEVVFKDFNNLNEECLECGIGDYIVCSYEAKDIKSIVTKEQFESMSYKIKE